MRSKLCLPAVVVALWVHLAGGDLCSAAEPSPEGANQGAQELRDQFGRALRQPMRAMPEEETKQRLRETKQEGETYIHTAVFEVGGRAESSRFWDLYKEKVMNVRLRSVTVLREKVVSVDYDSGRVISTYYLETSQTELAAGTAKLTLMGLSSDGVMKHIRRYGDFWKKALDSGATLCLGAAPRVPDPYAKAGAVALAGVLAIASKGVERAQTEIDSRVVDGRLNSDCEFVLTEEDLKNVPNLRGARELKVFVSRLEGVQAETTWDCDRGYTRIQVRGGQLTLDEEDMVKRMIARTDMLSAWAVLPQGTGAEHRPGEEWVIDANRLGFAVFPNGLDLDEITGSLHVVFDGYEQRSGLEDENLNGGKGRYTLATVVLDEGEDDTVEGKRYLTKDSGSKLGGAFTFKPKSGSLKVMVDKKVGARYVREADFRGKVTTYEREARAKILGGLEFSGEIEGRMSYLQTRFVGSRESAPGR